MNPFAQPAAAASALVVTCVCEGDCRQKAIALAQTLSLPYRDPPPAAEVALALTQTETHLELRDMQSGARLSAQFTPAELRRYRAGGDGPNPLRRAMGPAPRLVVDATAGLGRDAVHMATLGYMVTAIERNSVVAVLAQDGIDRARRAGLLSGENPVWLTGDARTLLPTLPVRPATVYLDPMFPPKRKKTAAVRKEMDLVRRLVMHDEDAAELFAIARRVATDRVVVKRPDDAPPLAPAPTASHRGKLVRYDVYRTRSS